jgi:hypothetical protein
MEESNYVFKAEEILIQVLGPELEQVISLIISDPGSAGSSFIEMPTSDDVDLTVSDLMSLVARTSNNYGRIARFAGIARAHFKLAEGRYKRKFKTALGGSAKNAQEREANAIAAAEKEFIEMSTLEAVIELAEAQETAARIASESARKLLDKVQTIQIAASREEKGFHRESDYTYG